MTPSEPRAAPDDRVRRAARSLLRSVRVAGVVGAFLLALLLGLALGWVVAAVVFVVLVIAWLVFVELRRRAALDRALATLGPSHPARSDADPAHRARWANVVDGLASSTGVESPELRFTTDETVNAAALAADGRTVLVVTEGLAGHLSQIELEAVAANLLGRVRDSSAAFATLVVGLAGHRLATVGPVTNVLARGLGDQRAVRSDLEAARLTRYPPGVVRALRVLDERGSLVAGALPGSAARWLAPAVDEQHVPAAVAATVMQPVELRAAVIEEL